MLLGAAMAAVAHLASQCTQGGFSSLHAIDVGVA
jgi:hypothetical protein